jgi:hypothetical protein
VSLTKRIWIDRDPAYESARREYAEKAAEYRSEFIIRLPIRRRNSLASRPHWDPIWPSSLARAARELEIEIVNVNEGMFFRTVVDRDEVEKRAMVLW